MIGILAPVAVLVVAWATTALLIPAEDPQLSPSASRSSDAIALPDMRDEPEPLGRARDLTQEGSATFEAGRQVTH